MFVTRLRRLLGIRATALLCCSFVLTIGAAPRAAAQETLAQAKVLYAAASYEEALAMLDKLSATGQDATAIAEYRIFCLLALGRSEDANKTIEMVLRSNPFYVPSEAQVPPRIQTVIKSARQKLLPGIVLASYADAKAAYERKDLGAAVQFERVLALLDDPDVRGVASLADLRTVAVGFRDLAQALATPPPAPPPPAVTSPPPPAPVAAAAPPPGGPAASSGASPGNSATPGAKPSGSPAPSPVATPGKAAAPSVPSATKTIYDATDAEVVGPVAVSQRLPNWAPIGADAKKTFNGVLHLIIDDRGNVTVADMRVPAHPTYDSELVNLARGWKFRPALRGGSPVAYMKLVSITLSPPK